ncbi:MAG TPA: hypothetical protein VK876_03190 [Rubrivivax sp.]|nr:hypothetical protein [Rubrivivax sp.]
MRTTVTLDPDVERLLRQAVHERDASFKQVINDALRLGLQKGPREPLPRYEPLTFDLGRPLVDLAKAGALAGELEDLGLIETLRAGR